MRILLLCGQSVGTWEQDVIRTLLASDHQIVGCLIDGRPAEPFTAKIKKNLKRGRGGYVLVMAWQAKFGKKENAADTLAFMASNGIRVEMTDAPYSDQVIPKVRQFAPDAMALIGGYNIVKEPMLSAAPKGVLSYHHGDMRLYRGMPPALWEMYNGESEMGMTVQVLAPGLDAGTPVVERSLQISRRDTLSEVRRRMFNESLDMMREAADLMGLESFEPKRIETFGTVYTLPNLRQWLVLNAKVAWRRLLG
ncbi:MAG: formyltransferase family protein [Actinomycetota bacterium]|jgi:methionyl-tRNA formyltransferase|nr:formyltransferase family protein [Actinomycetota bacterium]